MLVAVIVDIRVDMAVVIVNATPGILEAGCGGTNDSPNVLVTVFTLVVVIGSAVTMVEVIYDTPGTLE